MAWPAPPLIKLSITHTIIALFFCFDLHTDISQKFVFITEFVLNNIFFLILINLFNL